MRGAPGKRTFTPSGLAGPGSSAKEVEVAVAVLLEDDVDVEFGGATMISAALWTPWSASASAEAFARDMTMVFMILDDWLVLYV